jgi:hypothetical protein
MPSRFRLEDLFRQQAAVVLDVDRGKTFGLVSAGSSTAAIGGAYLRWEERDITGSSKELPGLHLFTGRLGSYLPLRRLARFDWHYACFRFIKLVTSFFYGAHNLVGPSF